MTSQAKLEIGKKVVEFLPSVGFLTEAVPNYLFIQYTNAAGKKIILRGGVEENKDGLLDKFQVITSPYLNTNFEAQEERSASYVTILEGVETTVTPFFEKIQSLVKRINSGEFDNKLTYAGHIQKCNNVIQFLIETAGLTFQLPKQDDGSTVFAPGTILYRPAPQQKVEPQVVHQDFHIPNHFETKLRDSFIDTNTLYGERNSFLMNVGIGSSLPFGTQSSLLQHNPNTYSHFIENQLIDQIKSNALNNPHFSSFTMDTQIYDFYGSMGKSVPLGRMDSIRSRIDSEIHGLKMDAYYRDFSSRNSFDLLHSQLNTFTPYYSSLNNLCAPNNNYNYLNNGPTTINNGLNTIDPAREVWGMAGGYLAERLVSIHPIGRHPAAREMAWHGGSMIGESLYEHRTQIYEGTRLGLMMVGRGTDDYLYDHP
jgi:hypothetical protein